jgi:hypothetical protein
MDFHVAVTLQVKSLMIDKSLHGIKTPDAIFHEHLSESLLRLDFKQTKNYPGV